MTVLDGLSPVNSYFEILENISQDEVLEIARKYLNLNTATISVMTPELK